MPPTPPGAPQPALSLAAGEASAPQPPAAPAAPAPGPAPAVEAGPRLGDARPIVFGLDGFGLTIQIVFLLAGAFADILIIRAVLAVAFTLVIASACVDANVIAAGSLAFAAVNLLLQVWSLAVMARDEAPVALEGDDAALWRCFWRRCGMPTMEFAHVLKLGRWRRFSKGDIIERRGEDEPQMYFVFQGRVRLAASPEDPGAMPLASGQVANLYLCNLFGVYIGMEADPAHRGYIIADTDVTLFTWDVAALVAMSTGRPSIAVPWFWRVMVLYLVAQEFCLKHLGMDPYKSDGCPEANPDAWRAGAAMAGDLADPLDELERPERALSCRAFFSWLWRSLAPVVPRGVRHHPAARSADLARARVLLATSMRRDRLLVPSALCAGPGAPGGGRGGGGAGAGGSRKVRQLPGEASASGPGWAAAVASTTEVAAGELRQQ